MGLTKGTWPGFPVDMGVTEWVNNNILGGALSGPNTPWLNPNQYAPTIGQESGLTGEVEGVYTDTPSPLINETNNNPKPNPTPQPTSGAFPADKTDGVGGESGPSIDDLISQAFGPGFSYLDTLRGDLEGMLAANTANVEGKVDAWGNDITNEGKDLEAGLDEQGRQLGESTRSAYADSIRSYNNLINQAMSQYGAGSSAGGVLQGIVAQELLRNRGKIGQQEVAGQAQLGIEQGKLDTYISKKQSDLKLWKEDAILKINENFQTALRDVEGKKYALEKDKTMAKLQVLQDAATKAQAVKDSENNFKMGLAQLAVEQGQTIAQRAFTVAEIQAIVAPIMGADLNMASAQSTTPQSVYNPKQFGKEEEIDKLNPLKQVGK